MEILKKNNALNPDNTIKDIAQETTKHSGSFSTMSPPPLYTGYYYDFITTAEMDATWEKTTVWTKREHSSLRLKTKSGYGLYQSRFYKYK